VNNTFINEQQTNVGAVPRNPANKGRLKSSTAMGILSILNNNNNINTQKHASVQGLKQTEEQNTNNLAGNVKQTKIISLPPSSIPQFNNDFINKIKQKYLRDDIIRIIDTINKGETVVFVKPNGYLSDKEGAYYGNFEGQIAKRDIEYKEYTLTPNKDARDRGVRRLFVGSDNKTYYVTLDHCSTPAFRISS
jgi:guanyl-specific ribonuclease Sa